MFFIFNISEIKNQSEFCTRLSLWSLPCEQSFLSCMAFNCVYDARVACQSRSWFSFYTPHSKYHIGFSGERMTIYRRYKKIQRFIRIHVHISRYIATDEANGNTNKRDVVPLLRAPRGSGGGDGWLTLPHSTIVPERLDKPVQMIFVSSMSS